MQNILVTGQGHRGGRKKIAWRRLALKKCLLVFCNSFSWCNKKGCDFFFFCGGGHGAFDPVIISV